MSRIFSCLLVVVILGCALGDISYAQTSAVPFPPSVSGDDQSWLVIKGNTVSLFYLPGANLRKIEARLRSRYLPVSPLYRDLLLNSSYPLEQRIGARLQLLLLRVQDVLGMSPVIPDFNIKVFRSRKDLGDELGRVAGARGEYVAFYLHPMRSIYTSEQDILDSVIAHEMGHAVIDSYFSVVPPPQVAEVIAGYVDEHLERN